MPFYDIDLSKPVIKPNIFLCLPNKTKIAKLPKAYDIRLKLSIKNEINELNFKLPFEDKSISKMKYRYLILIELGDFYSEYFLINDPEIFIDQTDEYKEMRCFSLAYQLKDRDVKNLNLDTKNLPDTLNEVLSLTKSNWSLGDYPFAAFAQFRSFEISKKSLLDFIYEDVAEAFGGLVVLFNTSNLTINLYQEDDIGINKGLLFDYGKYTEVLNIQQNPDNLCTRLKIYGQSGLSIQEINPTGQVYIDDFSYFLFPFSREGETTLKSSDYFSDELSHSILDFFELLNTKRGSTKTAESGTNTINVTIANHGLSVDDYIINKTRSNTYRKVTAIIDTNNFTIEAVIAGQTNGDTIILYPDGTYGFLLYVKRDLLADRSGLADELFVLETELLIIKDNLETAIQNDDPISALITDRDNKITEVNNKKIEILEVINQIALVNADIATLRNELSYDNVSNFSAEELEELQEFIIEDEYVNEKYFDDLELYDKGIEELSKRIMPEVIIDISIVNFLECLSEQRNHDKLVLGDIVKVKYTKSNALPLDISYTAKILELEFDFENADVNLLIGNINRIEDVEDRITRQLYESASTTNLLNNKKTQYDQTIANFDSRNDRNSIQPANPTIKTDGTAVQHALNIDGSANVSFEWEFEGDTDAHDIDGFFVYIKSLNSDINYIFGATISQEDVRTISSDKRAFILYGTPANQYYTFGVQTYRIVDNDIHPSGILKSDLIQPSLSAENPYRPSASVAFLGDVQNTIGGVPYDQVSKTPVTVVVADATTSNEKSIKRADFVVPLNATNAQVTINEAINSLLGIGGRVTLMEGNYIVNNSISMKSNITLEGQGKGTNIKIKNSHNTTIYVIHGQNLVNIKIRNMLLNGNSGNNTNTNQWGIYIRDISGLLIEDVSCFDFWREGIRLHLNCSDGAINNCYVERSGAGTVSLSNSGDGMHIENSQNISVSNCVFYNNGWRGIHVKGATCSNNSIVGCKFDGNFFAGVCMEGNYNVISSNEFINNIGFLEGVIVIGRGTLGSDSTTSNFCIVSSNTIIHNGYSGIGLNFSFNCTIEGNVIKDCGSNSDPILPLGFIVVNNSDDNKIQNNTCRRTGYFTYNVQYGIVIESSCQRNFITNNDLLNSGTSGGLSIAGGTNTITAAGNRV